MLAKNYQSMVVWEHMAKQELSKPLDEKLKDVATTRDLRRVKEKDRVLTPEDRGHPDWAYYGAHQEVVKLLQQIYQYEGRGMSDVFPAFVGCCHAVLDALPELVAAVLDGERDLRRLVQIADTEESRRLTAG